MQMRRRVVICKISGNKHKSAIDGGGGGSKKVYIPLELWTGMKRDSLMAIAIAFISRSFLVSILNYGTVGSR
jgi:hypothetical protein